LESKIAPKGTKLSTLHRDKEQEIVDVKGSTSAPPKVILCAGVKSSGSTWLYNVVTAVLKQQHKHGVMAFYADGLAMMPPGTERARILVIKSHEPSYALIYLKRLTRGALFVTLREPRDVIASVVQRFGHSFEGALIETERQAAHTVELVEREKNHLFRYESGFTEKSASIDRVARILGVRLSITARERIRRSLTRDEVRKKIGALTKRGKFGAKADPDNFDPTTQWHPGHVGDGRVGKFATVLSKKQQSEILAKTRVYRKRFGYLPARKR
jgi:hypothetical protein